MDDEQLRQILEAIRDGIRRMGLDDALGDFNDNINESNKGLSKQEILVNGLNKTFDNVNKSLAKSGKNALNLGRTIELVDDRLEEVEDSLEKLDLEASRDALATRYRSALYTKAAKDFSLAIGDVFVKSSLKATKTLVSGLQNGSSGISIASGLMTDAVDASQKGFDALSKTGEGLGQGLSMLRGRAGVFGIGLELASGALGYFTNAASDAAKFGIDILTKEVEKTVKTFHQATGAGALFARGMDDVRFYANRAGLTTDQFGEVLKNNSDLLARSGYTVTDGAKILGNVTSRFAVQTGKSGMTLQREMQNLGFGFQEQAEIAAQIVSDLKRTGAGTGSTNAAVAASTVELAKNMRVVASVMGEEAKGRRETAKKQAELYAFQSKINEIAQRTGDPGLPKRVELAMSLMSESNRRAAIQATVLDGAVTDVAANLTGGADAGRDFAQALLSGRTSMIDLTRGTALLNDRFQMGTNELGVAVSRVAAATGGLSEYSQAFGDQQQDSFKANSNNILKAISDADTLSEAQGELHNSVMAAESAAQQLRLSLENVLTPAIKKFGVVADQILDSVINRLREAGIEVGGKTSQAAFGGALNPMNWNAAQLTGGAMVLGGGILAATGIGAPAGIAIGTAGLATAGYGSMPGNTGKAKGGISTGPMSGYQETLHGTEAVVPLPDNRTIPVSLDSSSLTSSIERNNSLLTDIIKVLKEGNSNTSLLVRNTN